MQVRNRRNRRNRNQGDPSLMPVRTDATPTVSLVGGNMQIDFDTPVQLVSLPTAANNGGTAILGDGREPTAAVQDSPTRITITCGAALLAADAWSIPARGASIRTPSGGYVASATGTF